LGGILRQRALRISGMPDSSRCRIEYAVPRYPANQTRHPRNQASLESPLPSIAHRNGREGHRRMPSWLCQTPSTTNPADDSESGVSFYERSSGERVDVRPDAWSACWLFPMRLLSLQRRLGFSFDCYVACGPRPAKPVRYLRESISNSQRATSAVAQLRRTARPFPTGWPILREVLPLGGYSGNPSCKPLISSLYQRLTGKPLLIWDGQMVSRFGQVVAGGENFRIFLFEA
jgi:hypothetical protein